MYPHSTWWVVWLREPCDRAELREVATGWPGPERVGKLVGQPVIWGPEPQSAAVQLHVWCTPRRDILEIDLSSDLMWQNKHLNLWLLPLRISVKWKRGGWLCKCKENGRRDWSNPFGSWEADGWAITVNRPTKAEAYTRVNSRNWRATKRLWSWKHQLTLNEGTGWGSNEDNWLKIFTRSR